jgi:hypothetical protein
MARSQRATQLGLRRTHHYRLVAIDDVVDDRVCNRGRTTTEQVGARFEPLAHGQ